MDDLRYLLRVLRSMGRVIRRRVQQAWRAREMQKFVPLFMGGGLVRVLLALVASPTRA
jgi:hypothetical protein